MQETAKFHHDGVVFALLLNTQCTACCIHSDRYFHSIILVILLALKCDFFTFVDTSIKQTILKLKGFYLYFYPYFLILP